MPSSQNSHASANSEASPLVPPKVINSGDSDSKGNYYFLKKENDNASIAHSQISELEKLPYGATENEFASRPILISRKGTSASRQQEGVLSGLFGSVLSGLFAPMNQYPLDLGTIKEERQAAIKIEPKVFFANERTFLAWFHTSILLAGASIAIVTVSDNDFLDLLYGVVLLPIAIAFMLYSMHQYGKRAQMIRRRSPGPYEDIIGPAVLAVALMLSIVVQFSVKLYAMVD